MKLAGIRPVIPINETNEFEFSIDQNDLMLEFKGTFISTDKAQATLIARTGGCGGGELTWEASRK